MCGAKGIRTPAPTCGNTTRPAGSIRLVPVQSRSLPAVLFSGLDGVKGHRPLTPTPERSCTQSGIAETGTGLTSTAMGVIDDSPDEAVAAESSDSDSTAAWDGAGGDATRVAPDITQAAPESGCEPSSLSRSPVAQDYSGRSERNWWISPVFTGCGGQRC